MPSAVNQSLPFRGKKITLLVSKGAVMACGLICIMIAAVSGSVHSVPLTDGGFCRVIQNEINDCTSVLRIESVDSSGSVRWMADALPVRNDAVSGLVSESSDGKILFTSEFGEGYTDILLQLFSNEGDLLNSDTISLVCYDSPQALISTGVGFVLAWDSWSEERGVHLAFISADGSIDRTEFLTGTVNPGPVAMAELGNTVVVGVSPILSEGEILFFYSENGERLHAETPVLSQHAQLIESLQPTGAGTFSVHWKSLSDSDGNTMETATEHSI